MYAFIIKRLIFAVATLFTVLTLVFVLIRIVPGDPAQVILGNQAGTAAIDALRERLGLTDSLIVQYWNFLSGLLTGNWGDSLLTGAPVLPQIAQVLPYTIELTLSSMIVATALGVPLGIAAAIHRNRVSDYVIRVLSQLGLSFPVFVTAILFLLLFSIELRWFPVISAGGGGVGDRLSNLFLPMISLGLVMVAFVTRVTRSAMLEVLRQDYVRTAIAKGVPRRAVLWRHCLRNSLIPIVTVIGLYIGIQIGNSILVEIVFNRPGLGKLMVGSLLQRDYTMLQGLMVVYTFLVVAANLITDLTYGIIDPRVKYN